MGGKGSPGGTSDGEVKGHQEALVMGGKGSPGGTIDGEVKGHQDLGGTSASVER